MDKVFVVGFCGMLGKGLLEVYCVLEGGKSLLKEVLECNGVLEEVWFLYGKIFFLNITFLL